MLRLRQLCTGRRRVRCRSARLAHPVHITAVRFGRQQQHGSSSGKAPERIGALTQQHLAAQAFYASLETTEGDLVLEPMPSGSTQPTDVGHDSIAEQNAIDRPVDVAFSSDFAQMHDFRLDQHPTAPDLVRVLGLARAWVGAQDLADVALPALSRIKLSAARYQHFEFAFHHR